MAKKIIRYSIELKRVNEILRFASAFIAQVEQTWLKKHWGLLKLFR